MEFEFRIKIDNAPFVKINPTNFPKISLKQDKHTGLIEKTLSGNIVIGGITPERRADFELLYSVEKSDSRCKQFILEVIKKCNGTSIYKGLFTCNDGKWDIDRCTVSFSSKPLNDYTNLYKNWHKKHNILNVNPHNVDGKFYNDLVRIQDFEYKFFPESIPEDWKQLVKQQGYHLGFREEITTPYTGEFPLEPTGDGWVYFDKSGTTAHWYRLPDINAIASNIVISSAPSNPPSPKHIRITTANFVTFHWDVYWNPRFNSYKFNRGRKLVDVLYYLIQNTDPNILPNTANDISDLFTVTTSYVHGGVNELKNTLVADITDFKRPNSSDPATENLVSLKDLVKEIEVMFQAEMRIVNGKFRIEHESYFTKTLQNDLTISNPKRLVGKNSYKFESYDVPREERWVVANAVQRDFKGSPIVYNSNCVSQEEDNIKNNEIKILSADIRNIVLNPSKFSDNALAIYTVENGEFPHATGLLGGLDSMWSIISNYHFAITYLHDKYFRTNRPIDSGIMNEKETNFTIGVRPKIQSTIVIPLCCEEPNYNEYFGTQISKNAILKSGTIDLVSNTISLNLAHTIYADGKLSLGRQFDDSFDKSFK